jgi:hypothetical protein
MLLFASNNDARPKTNFQNAVHAFDWKALAHPIAAFSIRAGHDVAAQSAQDSAWPAKRPHQNGFHDDHRANGPLGQSAGCATAFVVRGERLFRHSKFDLLMLPI